MFGIWLWQEDILRDGADRVLSRCVHIGVTDIFFLTKGLSGAAACASDVVPAACERDLLHELLTAAHARGLRVHAWLTSASDAHYHARHPLSGRCHYTRGRDKPLLSLTDAEYIAYMQRFVRELCARYPIDGLHLDYIRYNHLLYGWGEEDLSRYAAQGASITQLREWMDRTFLRGDRSEPDCIFNALRAGEESAVALAAVRREDVRRFASSLIATAREARPHLPISAALMPEGAYADTTFADLHYGQNYADAAALYDFALPMAYAAAYEKDAAWVKSVAEGTVARGLKALIGLHAYDGGTAQTLRAEIATLQGTSVAGICLFRYGAFVPVLADNHSFTLVNTISVPLTAVRPAPDGAPLVLQSPLLPGEERYFPFPCTPDALAVYSGEKQVCAFLSSMQANTPASSNR